MLTKSSQNDTRSHSLFQTAPKSADAMMDGALLETSFPAKHETANICKLYSYRSANIIGKYAEQNTF